MREIPVRELLRDILKLPWWWFPLLCVLHALILIALLADLAAMIFRPKTYVRDVAGRKGEK